MNRIEELQKIVDSGQPLTQELLNSLMRNPGDCYARVAGMPKVRRAVLRRWCATVYRVRSG